MAMSDFAGDIDAEPGEPSLPSGVHLDMPDLADVDNVSQAPECASFGELGSGTISPEAGNVMAMSDFAGDIDADPGEPSMPSGVHKPDVADVDNVSQVPDCVGSGEPGSGTVSPGSGSVMSMSDFVSDFDPGPVGPWLGLAVMCDRQSFVNNYEQMQTWDCVYSIGPGHREASPESGDRLAVPDCRRCLV